MSIRFFSVLIAVACLLSCGLFAGCGSDIDVVRVSGQITNKSEPAAGVHVSFQPIAQDLKNPNVGRGSVAVTDAEGRYQLTTVYPELDGAVPGPHAIRLSTQFDVDPTDDAAEIPEDPIPQKFHDGSLKFTVPAEGTDAADFDIGS